MHDLRRVRGEYGLDWITGVMELLVCTVKPLRTY